MKKMTPHLVLALAAASLSVTACNQETPSPTETVRLALISDATHGGKPFHNVMTQEVTNTPVYSGDPDGTGSALITVNRGKAEVCWETSVSNITLPATASHIHHAEAGIRGPIVITLSAPDAAGSAHGCSAGVDINLLEDILRNPTSYYVNVHTTDYPASAIRAQLEH
jgi:hypothetical protein